MVPQDIFGHDGRWIWRAAADYFLKYIFGTKIILIIIWFGFYLKKLNFIQTEPNPKHGIFKTLSIYT